MSDPSGIEDPVKICTKCGAEKPLDEFYRSASARDGRKAHCKQCGREATREWATANPERRRQYRIANREKLSKSFRTWAAANQEHLVEYRRQRYAENREQVLAEARAWAEAHRDEKREYNRTYYAENAFRELERRHLRRAIDAGVEIGEVDIRQLWLDQDGICAVCREAIDDQLAWPEAFSRSLDHIVPLAEGGAHSQANLQWTHVRCNMRKGVTHDDVSARPVRPR